MPDDRDTGDLRNAERDGKEQHKTDAERDWEKNVEKRWDSYLKQPDRPEQQPRSEKPDASEKPAHVELTADPHDVNDSAWTSAHIRLEGERVGSVCVERDPVAKRSVIRDIAVKPEHRGRGVGSEALRQVELDEKRRGMGEMTADLSHIDTDGTEEGRKKLAGFWKRRGYSIERCEAEEAPIFATARKRL